MQNSDTTKYIIHAKIKADGVIERPDVIGAIFGQTEGLLGSDMDLRDLQKSGRIGRIEVNIKSIAGKSNGTIDIPSSLDKVETAILAASLETIDRIGPCIANISAARIEDVRTSKRKQIVDRAKYILTNMFDTSIPESQEITDEVRQAVRVEEMIVFGKDNVPAGPNVANSDAILVVEGRADVLNLLRYGIKNSIAVGGTNIPQTVIDMCKKKTVTAFTDGDRGGELIIKELLQVADIDFIARAPDGKGVEELTQKEVVKSLRQKIPVEQALDYYQVGRKRRMAIVAASSKRRAMRKAVEQAEPEFPGFEEPAEEPAVEEVPVEAAPAQVEEEPAAPAAEPARAEAEPAPAVQEQDEFQSHLRELAGTFSARLLDGNSAVIQEVAVRDLANVLKDSREGIHSVVFDGVITQRIVDIASEKGVKNLVGAKMGNVAKVPTTIHIVAAGAA